MRCCRPGFLKLKIFIMTELEELEEWDVDEGAMPCVQEVWIMFCEKLATVPSGLQSLATLQRLRLVDMPSSFTARLGEHGEDFVSFKHIPSIQIIQQFGKQ
jgi:disease resistance protein RPM1